MKDKFLKAAAITPDIRVGDTDFNTENIIKAMIEAHKLDVKLAVFPELVISGYTCNDLFLQDILLKGSLDGLKKIIKASENLDMVTIVGLPFLNNFKLYKLLYSPQKVTPKHPPQTRLSWYTPKIIELLFSPFSHGFHYPFSFSTFRDFRNCLTFYHLFFLSFSSLLSNKKPSKGSCFLPPEGTSFLFSYSFYFLVSSFVNLFYFDFLGSD